MASPPQSPRHITSVATPLANRKRKTGSNDVGEPSQNTPARQSRNGLGDTKTPYRLGSAQRTKESSGNSVVESRPSGSTKRRTTNATHSRTLDGGLLATADAPKQLEMDRFLESEMRDAVFCDPNFVENFLTVDSTRLQAVIDDCEDEVDAVDLGQNITRERQLYEPIRQVLNIIKEAVHGDRLPDFVDVSSEPIESHDDDIAGIKPDLVLFDGPTRHWETVRIPIEVKRQHTYLKAGMKQLTRYARAVFAHQLHRRHLYGMVVCKWQATFVRFDRAGILHSKPIDMREQREEFCKAFAGLMMLNEEEFGYDTAFTTRARSTGQLEFYVDLPTDAIPPEGEIATATNAKPITAAEAPTATAGTSDPPSTKPKLLTRRFRVMERLCHRKSIRGRATIVLRVREVIRPGFLEEPKEDQKRAKTRSQTKQEQQYEGPELLATRNYVLKLMWRDPNKKTEGEVLERLVGIYGVAQYMWHSDVFKSCSRSDCAQPMVDSCGECLDKTPSRDRVWTTKNMADLNTMIPEEPKQDEEPKYEEVQTDEYSEAYARRTSRIYCRLLMSTVGLPLCSAENPRQLVQAVLDAILGYWRLVNMGLLHRDISDGNVLLLQDGHGYSEREWKDPRRKAKELDSTLAESEKLLQSLLNKFDRDPTGMLNDFDLFTTHSGMGAIFFGDSATENQDGGVEANPNSDDKANEPVKRRKLDTTISASAPSSSSGKGKEREVSEPHESSLGRVTKADQGACQRIDFRTGTPTFMSLRVLRTPIGRPYEHSFMDDLESFFWLLLWCILERDERGNTNPGVDEVLNLLDQSNLAGIASKKSNLLASCVRDDGEDMKEALAQCKNVWATDPMIADLILEMGTFFNHVSRKKIFQYSPNKVFPKIVKMITNALDQSKFPTDSDSN